MIDRRRTRPRTNVTVESLDERIVPSAAAGHQALHALAARPIVHHVARPQAFAFAHAMQLRASLQAAHLASVQARQAAVFNAHALRTPAALAMQQRFAVANSVHAPVGASLVTPAAQIAAPVTPNAAQPVPNAAQQPLPANVDQGLGTIYAQYQEFVSGGGTGTFAPSGAFMIVVSGSDVGITAHGNGTGDFSAYVAALTGLGMQVQASDANTATVVGLIPINNLPNAATLAQTLSLTPLYKPILM